MAILSRRGPGGQWDCWIGVPSEKGAYAVDLNRSSSVSTQTLRSCSLGRRSVRNSLWIYCNIQENLSVQARWFLRTGIEDCGWKLCLQTKESLDAHR